MDNISIDESKKEAIETLNRIAIKIDNIEKEMSEINKKIKALTETLNSKEFNDIFKFKEEGEM